MPETTLLESFSRAAGTWVVTAQPLDQFLVTVDDSLAALYLRLAVKIPSDAYSSAQKEWSRFFERMTASRVEMRGGDIHRNKVKDKVAAFTAMHSVRKSPNPAP
jgi:hypothetical protein